MAHLGFPTPVRVSVLFREGKVKRKRNIDLHSSFGGGSGGVSQPIFAFYLKAHKNPKYTVAQVNNYPAVTAGVQVFATFLYGYISDGPLNGNRWPGMLFSAVWNFPTPTASALYKGEKDD